MSRRSPGIILASLAMLAFGIAEVVTAFRHSFFGLSTEQSVASTVAGAGIGLLYVGAGALALVGGRKMPTVALVCLGLDVAGRVAMVALGFFSVDTPRQAVGIALGTLIVIAFGVYLWTERTRLS